ncbi:DUF2076 family protein [Massilia sp. ST3]|uniref:DUF2076 domain-containing protein n=1 Tax=Massilia sp. ST3 TaxID=2824903 RepID=UPI001B82E21A|nr:DUF2076 family protein [Massilia sp. ST3]MBQ5946584.1 DUF2076 family protein [Massilia sp. ST3]
MSPSDAQLLHDFLGQLVQARGIQKDPEADALIQRAVQQQPDAAYLLVQRALLMEQALDSARARIAALENQVNTAQQSRGGGFLDHVWGRGRSQHAHAPQHYQHAHSPSYQHAIPGAMGRGGGFLGTMAATAAGVAAGSFLFHGLDNLFHDHGGGQHLLSDNDQGGGGLLGDQSGSALAEQAGLGDIGASSEGLLDSNEDSLGGFFDGDGSDEGLFG